MSKADLQTQLDELRARVARLEGQFEDDANPPERVDTVLLDKLSRRTAEGYIGPSSRGAVMYAVSYFSKNGDLVWHSEEGAPRITDAEPGDLSTLFSALGNADRLSIVQHILVHGPSERVTLQELIDTSSSGQLYHHLNTLMDAGVLELYKRGVYALSSPNVVRLLALLGVAFEITEEARADER